ncbi:MAG: RHS repeat-associated core domain-containing protein [Chitinophagales bacterium]
MAQPLNIRTFRTLVYYPFGMVMPGRSYQAGSEDGYKFGFNGKEFDPETYGAGNIYDYGFRIYNPRLGKFLTIDPLFGNYPWFSPYHFAGNSPILNIDLDGKENEATQPGTQNSDPNEAFIGDNPLGRPSIPPAAETVAESKIILDGAKLLSTASKGVFATIFFIFTPVECGKGDVIYNNGTLVNPIITYKDPSEYTDDELKAVRGRLLNGTATLQDRLLMDEVNKRFGVANKNSNDAIGDFTIYQITINGSLYKIGKADLSRTTDGVPTRIYQQVRKLRLENPDAVIEYRRLFDYYNITTREAKEHEWDVLQDWVTTYNRIPVGNQRSYSKDKQHFEGDPAN